MAGYRIGKVLGQGGMAIVYEGWRKLGDGTEQAVAIKYLMRTTQTTPEAMARFHREAKIGLLLSHPNVIKGYHFVRTGDALAIVMERLDGVSLAQLVKRVNLSYPVVRLILGQVLYALAYLHELGITHCDISPSNLLISRSGKVKLIDFGIATARNLPAPELDVPTFGGTPPYASPEQLRGQPLAFSTDLYSLAAVAYELLTGEPPFGSAAPAAILRAQTASGYWKVSPLPPQVPEDLRRVVMGLLHPEAERMTHDADDVVDILEESGETMASEVELGVLVRQAASVSDVIAALRDVQYSTMPRQLVSQTVRSPLQGWKALRAHHILILVLLLLIVLGGLTGWWLWRGRRQTLQTSAGAPGCTAGSAAEAGGPAPGPVPAAGQTLPASAQPDVAPVTSRRRRANPYRRPHPPARNSRYDLSGK